MNSVYQSKPKQRRKDAMGRAIAILTMIALVAGAVFGLSGQPVFAISYAQADIYYSGVGSVIQGKSDVDFSFTIENKSNNDFQFTAILDAGRDIKVTSGNNGTLYTVKGGSEETVHFVGDVAKSIRTGEHTINATFEFSDGTSMKKSTTIDISQDMNSQGGVTRAAADITYKLNNSAGIIAGADNTLSLEIFNRGNTAIKNSQISLELPDGLSINNAAGIVNAGYIAIGDTYKCQFPIAADDSLTSKNYAIKVKIAGGDSSNESVNLEQTLYIPVKGTGDKVTAKDVEITNISMPQQVLAGDEFTLAFDIANRGSSKLADTKVTVEVPEGLANKTKNVFVVTGLASGSSQKFSVTMFGTDKATDNQYKLVKITAESPDGESTASVSQYAGTMVKAVGGNAKTPQLMVSSYTYGGTYVQAGENFGLSLGLYNTSATQDLVNVKITVTSDDGTFIPVKSSNSFYIDKIQAKQTASHGITMTTKRDAEQKTSSMTIDMSYEDAAGNAFTSKDVISVPVMQETRLVVDDVVAPPELYAGMQSSISVDFYNMGKTVLNNLRANVQGDFDAPQSNMYYVGNMETGKSDSYDFSFVPRQPGPMSGTVTFTYEDAAGNEQRLEKPFEVTVMEEVPWEDPDMMEPPTDENKIPWIPIGIGGGVAVVIIGLLIWRKHRKKKRDLEMEIDE